MNYFSYAITYRYILQFFTNASLVFTVITKKEFWTVYKNTNKKCIHYYRVIKEYLDEVKVFIGYAFSIKHDGDKHQKQQG